MQCGFKDPKRLPVKEFSDERCLTDCGCQGNSGDSRIEGATINTKGGRSRFCLLQCNTSIRIVLLSQIDQLGKDVMFIRVESVLRFRQRRQLPLESLFLSRVP